MNYQLFDFFLAYHDFSICVMIVSVRVVEAKTDTTTSSDILS
jgi:hypothetical protein